MRIDVHSHFLSEKVARVLEKRSRFPYSRFVDGTYHLHCCQGLTMPLLPSGIDMQRKLDEMDSAGIDVAVLSFGIPGPEMLGKTQADKTARLVNDLLAEIIAVHPQRFWGYATLGFGDIDASLKELDRCFSSLQFRGLQLFSNLGGKTLDSPEFRPIFARMAELQKPIFIHPTVPLNLRAMADLIPVPVLAFMVDSTIAAMRLALSGIIAEYSAAPIIIPHVGAAVPYLMARLDGRMAPGGGPGATKAPSEHLKMLYMDTVAYGIEPLQWCYSLMGADHLVLGTDHPYGSWRQPIDLLQQLNCMESEREQMLHGNAERLFR
ncbi:MAG: amidohydrolase family protein [Deltaproteobacteria bacterium]|nr:amidohydrolase family protein [Deltaproteobacteria bacterium]